MKTHLEYVLSPLLSPLLPSDLIQQSFNLVQIAECISAKISFNLFALKEHK